MASVNPDTLGRWLVCAVRYALPRQSYIVASIAEDVQRYASYLSQNDRHVIARDVRDALADPHMLRADCDRQPWRDTLTLLESMERASHA